MADSFDVILDFDFAEMEGGIKREVQELMKRALFAAEDRFRNTLSQIIRRRFRETPEYSSLLPGGALYHELGVLNSQAALEDIEEVLVKNIKLRTSGTIVYIEVFNENYGEFLSLSTASFVSENGHNVPWLEWLLVGDDGVLLAEYTYIPKTSKKSRTGFGIMYENRFVKDEGVVRGWRLSAPGGYGNNWLVRMFANEDFANELFDTFDDIIIDEFRKGGFVQ